MIGERPTGSDVGPGEQRPAERTARSPITLAFLFYLLTLGGIISACLRLVTANPAATREALGTSVTAGGIAVSLLAAFLALVRGQSWPAALLTTLAGLALGFIAGGLTLVSPTSFATLISIAFAGCWLIIASMCLTARY